MNLSHCFLRFRDKLLTAYLVRSHASEAIDDALKTVRQDLHGVRL
jgi:hypothetical protein